MTLKTNMLEIWNVAEGRMVNLIDTHFKIG